MPGMRRWSTSASYANIELGTLLQPRPSSSDLEEVRQSVVLMCGSRELIHEAEKPLATRPVRCRSWNMAEKLDAPHSVLAGVARWWWGPDAAFDGHLGLRT